MSAQPHNLYRSQQVREMDRFAIDYFEIPGNVLLERAGEAAFKKLTQLWPNARTLAVMCGIGNNAGDGFVLARLAQQAGIDTTVYQVGDVNKLHGDSLAASQRLFSVDIVAEAFVNQHLSRFDIVVDALLGTGLTRDVQGDWWRAIESINHTGQPIFAIDIPSGLNGDTGMPMGLAVHAHDTISFIALKQGLLTGQAADYVGNLLFDDLKIPREIYNKFTPAAVRLDYQHLVKRLKPRARTAHKGQTGHLVIIGGDRGYSGAVMLAGEAALRTGAGLVSIATRDNHATMLTMQRPELMCHGVESASALANLLDKADAITIGPGMGQSAWATEMFNEALNHECSMVVDADALNLLAKQPKQNANWILTPHPGEAARLLSTSAGEIQADRFAALTQLVERYAGVVVLKGRGTLIHVNKELIGVCDGGNPGMACGGMGDVLSGLIGGLIVQGLSKANATRLAVCIHSLAADSAAKKAGERGLLPSDLMTWIRYLVNPA